MVNGTVEEALKQTSDEELEEGLKSLADKGLIEVNEQCIIVTAKGERLHKVLKTWGIEVWVR